MYHLKTLLLHSGKPGTWERSDRSNLCIHLLQVTQLGGGGTLGRLKNLNPPPGAPVLPSSVVMDSGGGGGAERELPSFCELQSSPE